VDRIMCIFRRKVEIHRQHFHASFGVELSNFCHVDGFDLERFLDMFPDGQKKESWLIDRLLLKPMTLKRKEVQR
jgi:hypothetical protein